MNLALLTYRFPWPVHTGDRLRAVRWLDAMLPLGKVTLVAPAGEVPARYRSIEHVKLNPSAAAFGRAAARAALRSLPLHTLAAAGFDWDAALRRLQDGDEPDVAVVLLSRCDPWLVSLHARMRILDAIDSSALSMEMRASAAGALLPAFWRREARLATSLEGALEAKYDRVMAVSAEEAPLFGGGAIAAGSGVELHRAPDTATREFDFGFWGRLAYFVNRDAVRRLLDAIWPAIRRELPTATLLIAGAEAPAWVRRWHGRDGVTVISPIGDRPALLRRVSIGVFPLRSGTGTSNKPLEAAEAGCAVVATADALRGLEILRSAAVVAEPDAALAEKCVRLARDRARAAGAGAELRRIAVLHYDAAEAVERLRDVIRAGGAA